MVPASENVWNFYNSNGLKKCFLVNWYNYAVCNLHFKNVIFNIHTFKGFVKKSGREIRVRDFGEGNSYRMIGYEIDHDSH